MIKRLQFSLLLTLFLVQQGKANTEDWWLSIHSGFRYDYIKMSLSVNSFNNPIIWDQIKSGKNLDLETFIARNLNDYFSLKAGCTYARKAYLVEASEQLAYTSIYNLYQFEFRYELLGLALQTEGILFPHKEVSPFLVTGVKQQWKLSEKYLQKKNNNTSEEVGIFNSSANSHTFLTMPTEVGLQYRYNAQLGIKLSFVYEHYWNTPMFLMTNLVSVGALFKLNYYFGHPQPQLDEEEILEIE